MAKSVKDIRKVFIFQILLILFICFSFSHGKGDMSFNFNELAPEKAFSANEGVFSTLTYNIAGLPEGISQSSPSKNNPEIGGKINAYDLVLLQEDFWYHDKLTPLDRHRFQSPYHSTGFSMGSGLSAFSHRPLRVLKEVAWKKCNGVILSANDCLAPKGFSYGEIQLKPGSKIHVYNLHMDAGSSQGDTYARRAQLNQLTTFLAEHSLDAALIIGGDFNINPARSSDEDKRVFADFLKKNGLTDSCEQLHCANETIDRILFRGNPEVALSPIHWEIPPQFTDPEGTPLSDHDPIAVQFQYSLTTTADLASVKGR